MARASAGAGAQGTCAKPRRCERLLQLLRLLRLLLRWAAGCRLRAAAAGCGWGAGGAAHPIVA